MKPSPTSYPNLIQALGITALVMVILYLFGLTIRFMAPLLGVQAALFIYYTMAMSTSLWIIHTYGRILGDSKAFVIKMARLKPLCLISIGTLALLVGIIYPVSFFIPVSETTRDIFQATFYSINGFTFLAIVVAAPIFEELIFRGILLDGLLKNYPVVWAIIISSILFGLFHINPLQIASAFIGGIYIGWIYHQTRNLSYCMLIHFIVNLVGFILLYSFGIENLLDLNYTEAYGDGNKGIMVIAGAILVFGTCLYFIGKEKFKNEG